jgi:hypothetical protein
MTSNPYWAMAVLKPLLITFFPSFAFYKKLFETPSSLTSLPVSVVAALGRPVYLHLLLGEVLFHKMVHFFELVAERRIAPELQGQDRVNLPWLLIPFMPKVSAVMSNR